MKIYIAHSKDINYKEELYQTIRTDDSINKHNIILPHEINDKSNNDRNFYKTIDLVIAECSKPSTGMGIELGWLYDDNIPIYCIYKQNSKISTSIYTITNKIYEYKNKSELLTIIKKIIDELESKRNR